jgi:hypothetical protein
MLTGCVVLGAEVTFATAAPYGVPALDEMVGSILHCPITSLSGNSVCSARRVQWALYGDSRAQSRARRARRSIRYNRRVVGV